MGDKVPTIPITSLNNSSTATNINTNIDDLSDALDNVVWRDGTLDLTGNLNANSKRLINVGAPVNMNDAARLQDIADLDGVGVIEVGQNFIANGAGAVTRSLADRGQDFLSVLDFIPINLHAGILNGTNNTDLYAYIVLALTAAQAQKRALYFPGGKYKVSQAITLSFPGFDLRGDGWYPIGDFRTVIITTAATPGLIISNKYGRISGIGFDGNSTGTYGIVCKNASSTHLSWVDVRNFDNDGVLFDPDFGGGATGNNNSTTFEECTIVSNGGNGVHVKFFDDNNNLNFVRINCSANALNGLLAKAEGGVVDKCLFETNGHYGVRLGESSDASFTQNWKVDACWVENNTLGGIFGSSKSANCWVVHKINSVGQAYSIESSNYSNIVQQNASGVLRTSNDSVAWLGQSANGAEAYLTAVNPTGGTNVNLNLVPQGTGRIVAHADINLNSGKVLRVNGEQVVGAQQAAIANATDAATAISQLNLVLAALRTHGLIDT